ncbi:hypothetical protein [Niabella drilacis]|uniref:TonB protein C-terminal n=1 Tax=Niabella drilacis (strain DSM 25811 / CCM 8410 / CCUG 62505 / LMG 26954 / E90) TaxID=1285928 RepID=A0A1G7C7I3_NIADE|nr:hypothetical protein [Niabella drilacis]SDE34636.1 hypothetical protein SAMN04487894_1397 [Niabella drilacis]
MRQCILLLFVFTCAISSRGQRNVPVHIVRESNLICGFSTNAVIDSSLWQRYLDDRLFLAPEVTTKIPEGVYEVEILYIVDTSGWFHLYKVRKDPGFGLGKRVEQLLLKGCPYRWSPATQNGRPVKSYHRQLLVFDTKHWRGYK